MNNLGSVLQDFLRHKYPGARYACGESYESIVWSKNNPLPMPTLQECVNGIADYEVNHSTYEYKLLRSIAYPEIIEQLDALWHSMDSNEIPRSESFYLKIKAVKDQYPKSKQEASNV